MPRCIIFWLRALGGVCKVVFADMIEQHLVVMLAEEAKEGWPRYVQGKQSLGAGNRAFAPPKLQSHFCRLWWMASFILVLQALSIKFCGIVL